MVTAGLIRRRLQQVLLAVAVLSVAVHAWDLTTPGLLDRTGRLKAPDFLQFYTYGWLARDGRWNRLYDADAHAEVARERVDPRMTLTAFRPNYSPVVAVLMAPFAALPFLDAWALWSAISVVLYALALALVATMTTHVRKDPATLALAAIAFPALFIVVRYGQITALSLLLIAASAWLHSRQQRFAAGIALGALAYKPNLLLVPVLALTAMREWRVLSGLALGACIESAAGIALVGWTGFMRYLGILAALAAHPDWVQAFPTESHSFRGFVRLLTPWPPGLILASISAVIVGTWAVYRVWQQSDDPRLRWAALTTATLIATPHLITYDVLLLSVTLMLAADWVISSRWPLTRTWWVALLLLYGAAWPGTLVARLYSLQPSTVGMALTLWLLTTCLSRPTSVAPALASDSSSIKPIISS